MYDGFLKMVLIIFICNWTRGVMGSNPSEGSYAYSQDYFHAWTKFTHFIYS